MSEECDYAKDLARRLTRHSDGWIEQMDRLAGDDDEVRIRLAAAHLRLVDAHMDRMREYRDDAAVRLRERGVPMTRIAKLARINDSALARRLFARGSSRLVRRGGALGVALLMGWLVAEDLIAALFTDPVTSTALALIGAGGQ